MAVKHSGGQPYADFLKVFPLQVVGARVLDNWNHLYAGVSQFPKDRWLGCVRLENSEHGDFMSTPRLAGGQ